MATHSHKVLVKICGITRAQDARLAEKLGAYALGFNFYEKSPRSVSPADAWKIRKSLNLTTEAVGVFVNWKAEVIMYVAHALQLDAVQLHGDETPKQLAYLQDDLPVIKAFRVGPGFSLSNFKKFRRASFFLLDAAAHNKFGGTGKTFDWSIAKKASSFQKIILAGGLTPENVAEAILAVRPYAVDVASGVESRPGQKDPGKLRAFFSEVARASRALSRLG
jgi:phosphoribosylanthranilate isomerase